MDIPDSQPPHGSQEVLVVGNTKDPKRALLLLHGRGGSANNMVGLTAQLSLPSNVIVIAPQAANHTWYPERFLVPQVDNQPDLDSALERVDIIIESLHSQYGLERSAIALAGFSQGACLVAEYLKRYQERYLGGAIMSGGLIGEEVEVERVIAGSLAETPLYIGCDEVDFHIPKERVEATAEYFTERGARVFCRLYQGLGHNIHPEALGFIQNRFDASLG